VACSCATMPGMASIAHLPWITSYSAALFMDRTSSLPRGEVLSASAAPG
jgi:hypothetical protein